MELCIRFKRVEHHIRLGQPGDTNADPVRTIVAALGTAAQLQAVAQCRRAVVHLSNHPGHAIAKRQMFGTNAMRNYVIVEAPTNLGLHPGGVERLSSALLAAGFADRLRAPVVSRVVPPPYDPEADPETHILNARAVATYARQLADPVGRAIDARQFPIVLGGDCSILLGNLLALRRRGRFGLLFVDGHNDCYQPGIHPTGEAAAMDLAQSVGVGPEFLTNIDGLRPYVRVSDTIVFGTRDAPDGYLRGRMPTPAGILEIELSEIRHMGLDAALAKAIRGVRRPELSGVWLHLDVDVLDDAIMPAVDYRRPGGLSWTEFETSVHTFLGSGLVVGMNVTIFNPSLDADGTITTDLTECLLRCLAQHTVREDVAHERAEWSPDGQNNARP